MDEVIKKSLNLAETWQNRANSLLNQQERAIQEQMKRLLVSPGDKIVMTKMIDQSFRSRDEDRVSNQIEYTLKKFGVPEFFNSKDKLLMRLFLGIGKHFPHISIPRFIDKMRDDSSRSVIPGEPDVLKAHLEQRKREGVTMNINHLGEAVLGEEESRYRFEAYLKDLKAPDVEYISIKISTIYSQISSLAFEKTVEVLNHRLKELFRVARDNKFKDRHGAMVSKFVNLDMEEYRDLEITLATFTQTLDEEEFKDLSAGIVLQAYIPDSYEIQKELTQWAIKRVESGGAPIKVRIVKGANMEMEQVESSLHNWPLAPYNRKIDTDANYKRMVDFGTDPEHMSAVHLGIASHNLFELAYAYVQASEKNVLSYLSFEMLEGMADHVRRAIQQEGEQLVLYAPVATKETFISAIAYLLRRLDENTSEENFMRYSPHLKVDSREWQYLKQQFLESCEHKSRLQTKTHRVQNRNTESLPKPSPPEQELFRNEPDTDWALNENRIWAKKIRDKWMPGENWNAIQIPIVIQNEELFEGRKTIDGMDPNQLPKEICAFTFATASAEDLQKALQTAKQDPDGWRQKSARERQVVLKAVANEIRKARADLIGAAATGTGKVFTEADVEVSEAVDFSEYYPYSACNIEEEQGLHGSGKGVGLVISPWNFPIAIPCGGIMASLAAGNTVLFKPASSAVLPAWKLCQCFWRAGVSRNVLQFIPCSGELAGNELISQEDIDFVILTGGTETGMRILKTRPDIFLAAETGGKNATIVSAMSDRDQAVANVIHSAFSNTGQKCSATSLLILEKEVYEDESFKKQLVDAAKSMQTGSAWEFENKIGPLIQAPSGDLHEALTKLSDGETWALKPENLHDNPHLWTPGIKWGVKPGSKSHLTEFFGPVLSVLCADNLEHAIRLANQPEYGLTSGLESLDQREQDLWKEKIIAGNMYINRGTTGAIVLRQPFGGLKASSIGTGFKAGGPTYVTQFMNFNEDLTDRVLPVSGQHALLTVAEEVSNIVNWDHDPAFVHELKKCRQAILSYLHYAEKEFYCENDYFHLRGQDNLLRYLPAGKVCIRMHETDSLFDVVARCCAATVARCQTTLSIPDTLNNSVTRFFDSPCGRRILKEVHVKRVHEEGFKANITSYDRIRFAAPDRVPESISREAAKTAVPLLKSKVMMNARIELPLYLLQQSISNNYHRYGNLGERAAFYEQPQKAKALNHHF